MAQTLRRSRRVLEMKLIFAGTPDFAVPALQSLIDSKHDVLAVYTQPDRPAGRGRQLKASPIKQLAERYSLKIFQPETLRDQEEQEKIRRLQPDAMIVAAYGLIFPRSVLEIPKYGCINIHASILPRWRGAAPIQRAIQAGDTESGITIMQMSQGLDEGDILEIAKCPISADDTGGSLHDKMAALSSEALLKTLQNIESGNLKPEAQNDSLATYAKKLSKTEAQIDWSQSAKQIDRNIRAFNPFPIAFTKFKNDRLRIWEARVSSTSIKEKPGKIVAIDKESMVVATGEGCLRILKVQQPGGKPIATKDWLNAHNIATGEKLC